MISPGENSIQSAFKFTQGTSKDWPIFSSFKPFPS